MSLIDLFVLLCGNDFMKVLVCLSSSAERVICMYEINGLRDYDLIEAASSIVFDIILFSYYFDRETLSGFWS